MSMCEAGGSVEGVRSDFHIRDDWVRVVCYGLLNDEYYCSSMTIYGLI